MDRISSHRLSERQFDHPSQAPPPAPYPQFPPPATQPPYQMPILDPFHTNRDPFLPGSQDRRGSIGLAARVWPPAQVNGLSNGHPHRTPPPQQNHQPLPPPPPPSSHGLTQMSLPYDPSRRRSLGGASSPPQFIQGLRVSTTTPAQKLTDIAGPFEQAPPPASFQSRQMPPPSPPQMPSSASSLPGSGPRGPPTASPFAGLRDLASFSTHRSGGGMSISSILGGSEDRKPHGSPHPPPAAASTPKAMPPPSPGRARSSSMREGYNRNFRDVSPPRNIGEPRPTSAVLEHERSVPEARKEGISGSPLFQHGFRAYQPPQQEQRDQRGGMNGHGTPGRPNSQPIEHMAPRGIENIIGRDAPNEGRFSTFRQFVGPLGPTMRSDVMPRHDIASFQNGNGPTSQPAERALFSSPQFEQERVQPGLMRFQPGPFSTPLREEQAGLFRPVYQPGQEPTRDLIELRQFHQPRSDGPRSSPPLSDVTAFEHGRNGFIDRPMTLEEHDRMEAFHREREQRKESDGSTHRALLNISPEFNRKGRNSPLPQAVQGAQPRHVGPGGDNPGIKMEFGRMFSGLGSGVGTATPTAGQSVNGAATPSRMSPSRHVEGGDLVSTAVAEIQEGRGGAKTSVRGGRRNGRRARDEDEKVNGNGRETPDTQRGSKRSKTSHTSHHHHHHVHPHHHHHHHHEPIDNGPSPFNMLRFPPNPLSHQSLIATPSHHHHHHHGSHAHPGHHHHHPPRSVPPARKPTTTVMSRRLVEDCAKKPRKHLGSQLYTTELSLPTSTETHARTKTSFSSKMKPIPVFEGKENCTYTIRVPRSYLTVGHSGSDNEDSSYLEEICKRHQIWGTDVYTDDSDVVAAAIHSGWLQGDFGDFNDDIRDVDEPEQEDNDDVPATLALRPRKPVRVPPDHDAHITVLILPPLESYASTHQHHIHSREWKNTHDGMSFMIHKIDFVDEGSATRSIERTAAARKQRMAVEEAKRKEAAAGLLMFANGGGGVGGTVAVGA